MKWGFTRAALAGLLCAVGLLMPGAGAAHAARGMEVALGDDNVFRAESYFDRARALDRAVTLNVTRLRVNMVWAAAVGYPIAHKHKAPKFNYEFGQYDSLIEAAALRGIKVQITLTGPAPAWVTGNHRIGGYKPRAGAFAHFAQAVATHFRGQVDRYSVWNEPNHPAWLSPKKKIPRLYRALYAGAYRAIKAADPDAQVLIGETSPYSTHGQALEPLAFLRAITCSKRNYRAARKCTGLKTDGYAHHPYDLDHKPTYRRRTRDSVTVGTLSRLQRALKKLAKRHALETDAGLTPGIYLTEYGYIAGHTRHSWPEGKRAKFLRKAFDLAAHAPGVREMTQYLLIKPPKAQAFFDTSILTRHGGPTKPFRALRDWSKRAVCSGLIQGYATAPPGKPPYKDPLCPGGQPVTPPSAR